MNYIVPVIEINYFFKDTLIKSLKFVSSNALEQYKQTFTELEKNIRSKANDGVIKTSNYNFPPTVLEQLLANAIMHCKHGSLSHRETVLIEIYPDKIVFKNNCNIDARKIITAYKQEDLSAFKTYVPSECVTLVKSSICLGELTGFTIINQVLQQNNSKPLNIMTGKANTVLCCELLVHPAFEPDKFSQVVEQMLENCTQLVEDVLFLLRQAQAKFAEREDPEKDMVKQIVTAIDHEINNAASSIQSSGFDAHPLLNDLGGIPPEIDLEQIINSENKQDHAYKNKLRHALKQKLQNKLKVEQPRFRAESAPKLTR